MFEYFSNKTNSVSNLIKLKGKRLICVAGVGIYLSVKTLEEIIETSEMKKGDGGHRGHGEETETLVILVNLDDIKMKIGEDVH